MTVGRHFVPLALLYLYPCFDHELARLVAADRVTQGIERPLHPAAAIGVITGFCDLTNHFQQRLVVSILRLIGISLQVTVIATAGNTQESAHQANRAGLLPLGDKRILHFVSLAKKTVASFKMRFSISSCFTRTFNFLISSCSGVSLPLPLNACPSLSSRYSLIQRPS